MSEPKDIAVVLGAAPEPLPSMVSVREFKRSLRTAPPQIVQDNIHQGSKFTLNGPSKASKSWCMLDLAISVASGQPWWGHPTVKSPVAYLNFELHEWAIADRLNALWHARPECKEVDDTLFLWNLRGKNADISILRPELEAGLMQNQFGLVLLDPAYKLLGNRDENSNGDIAALMNEFEAMARSSKAAVGIAHHFAKGDSASKNAIDRSSGAGAWSRDPDSIITLTPHEEDDCFSVNLTLRNLPRIPDFAVAWEFPLMRPAPELNPDALRRQKGRAKVCTEREFVEQFISSTPKDRSTIVAEAGERKISARTTDRYLKRNVASGHIGCGGGQYWLATPHNQN